MRHPFRTFLLALAAFCWLCPATGHCASGERIELGMSAAFSGTLRNLGIELYRGARTYFDALNARGGVNGRSIEILPMDDGYDARRCLDNTVTLIQRHEVFALFSYVGTPTTTNILPLLTRYDDRDMLLLFPLSGAEPLRRPPYVDKVFNLRASYNDEARALVEGFLAQGLERIAVLYQADSFGRNGWDGVRRALAAHHLVMAAEASYPGGVGFDFDMAAQVKLLADKEPQAVICAGTSEACAAFLRDAHAKGLTAPVAALSIVDPQTVIRLLGPDAAPGSWPGDLIVSMATACPYDMTKPAVREFLSLMEKAPLPPQELLDTPYTPSPFSPAAFEGFLSAKVFAMALERTGMHPDRRALARALLDPAGFDVGLDGPLVFSPDRHQAMDRIHFMLANGQKLTPIKDFSRWRP